MYRFGSGNEARLHAPAGAQDRLHKARNLAVVTLDGRNHCLGTFGSPESKAEYDRVVREWLANDRFSPPAKVTPDVPGRADLTISELILRYWTFAEGYYVRDGEPSRAGSWATSRMPSAHSARLTAQPLPWRSAPSR